MEIIEVFRALGFWVWVVSWLDVLCATFVSSVPPWCVNLENQTSQTHRRKLRSNTEPFQLLTSVCFLNLCHKLVTFIRYSTSSRLTLKWAAICLELLPRNSSSRISETSNLIAAKSSETVASVIVFSATSTLINQTRLFCQPGPLVLPNN